jgi:nucleoid-associated protein YgaU
LLIFLAVWAGVRVAHAGDATAELAGHEYVVRHGDTLWGIAAAHYRSSVDLRRAVYEVRLASGLEGSDLRPGDRLTLPHLSD